MQDRGEGGGDSGHTIHQQQPVSLHIHIAFSTAITLNHSLEL